MTNFVVMTIQQALFSINPITNNTMTIYNQLPRYLNHRDAVLEYSGHNTQASIKKATEQAKTNKLRYRVIEVCVGVKGQNAPHLFIEQKGITLKEMEENWDCANLFELLNYMQNCIVNGIYSDVKQLSDKMTNEQIKTALQWAIQHKYVKLQDYLIHSIK